MNKAHLEFCASDEWAGRVQRHIIPWVVQGIDLGDNVLEIGPGPGRTTEVLLGMLDRLTAIEVDAELAAALEERLGCPNLEVVHADATWLPQPRGTFSGALSFTMLHHVPTAELQDRLFAEVARVLRQGGVLAGVDSLDSPAFRELHIDDVCNPLDPATLAARLEKAGFEDIRIDLNEWNQVRFQAFARTRE